MRVGGTIHLDERALVVDRHDLDELAPRAFPIAHEIAGAEAAGVTEVVLDQATQDDLIGFARAAPGLAAPDLDVLRLFLLPLIQDQPDK